MDGDTRHLYGKKKKKPLLLKELTLQSEARQAMENKSNGDAALK